MNRHVVAGILGLALAGCAQDRSVMKSQKSKLGPVALTPAMPSIHDAINMNSDSIETEPQLVTNPPETGPRPTAAAERGGPADAPQQSELAVQTEAVPAVVENASPALVGEQQPVAAASTEPTPNQATPEVVAGSTPMAEPAPIAAPVNDPAVATSALTPEGLANPVVQPAVDAAGHTAIMEERDPLLGANPDIMPMVDLPPDPAPKGGVTEPQAASPAPEIPNSITVEPTPRPSTTIPAVSPTDSTPIAEPVAPQLAPTPPQADPLLGPNPEIMPVDVGPTAAVAAPTPQPTQAPSTPSANPAAQPTPAVAAPATPVPASTPVPVVVPAPAVVPRVNANPELVAPPASNGSNDSIDLPSLSDPDSKKTSALTKPLDGQVSATLRPGTVLTSSMFVEPQSDKEQAKAASDKTKPAGEPTAIRSKLPPRAVFEAGRAMAKVGDEVITLHELTRAMRHRLKTLNIPPTQRLAEEDYKALAEGVLNDLVEKRMVVQEAKREIKNPKQLQTFMDIADKIWADEELPPLLRKYSVTNIYELKQKLGAEGESIEAFKETHRQDFLFRGFIDQKLGPKWKVELPDMIDYYNEHLREFDLPAQVTWREVAIEFNRHPNRADAKKAADAALARLLRGEDFVAVATELTEGPNKANGGLWKTAPGSYNVAKVNVALETLPIRQISQVIEGPTSFHIVRVEDRRTAGPATFAEVQDSIRKTLRTSKVREHSGAYLDKLRKKTLITTHFDDPQVKQASADRETAQQQKTAVK